MVNDYRFEVYTYNGKDYKQYVVKYFDFDNVIGVGDTIDEAIEEAKGNLEFYIDFCKDKNIPVPAPSAHEDLEFSGKVTLRMSKTLHKLVDERAKKEDISINALLNEAVTAYVYQNNTIDETIDIAVDRIKTAANESFNVIFEAQKEDIILKNAKMNRSDFFYNNGVFLENNNFA